MLNLALIEGRLVSLSSYLSILEELSHLPEEEFLSDKTKTGAAESYLRRSLEVIFDVGRHILAKSGHVELAGEYKSIARGLERIGVVDAQLGARLVQMAGYRNRMVHIYSEVTDEELYAILTENLADVKEFIRQVREFLRKQGLEGP